MSWTTWGWWIATGVAALAVVLTALARPADATVLRGRSALRITIIVTLVSFVASSLAHRELSLWLVVVSAAIVFAAWRFRNRMLLVNHDAAATATTIETCARRLVLDADARPHGFDIAVPGGALRLHVRSLGATATLIRLAPTTSHRKVELFERLLVKQYRRALPTIRVRS